MVEQCVSRILILGQVGLVCSYRGWLLVFAIKPTSGVKNQDVLKAGPIAVCCWSHVMPLFSRRRGVTLGMNAEYQVPDVIATMGFGF